MGENAPPSLSRRDFLKLSATGLGLLLTSGNQAFGNAVADLLREAVPLTGERMLLSGIGYLDKNNGSNGLDGVRLRWQHPLTVPLEYMGASQYVGLPDAVRVERIRLTSTLR